MVVRLFQDPVDELAHGGFGEHEYKGAVLALIHFHIRQFFQGSAGPGRVDGPGILPGNGQQQRFFPDQLEFQVRYLLLFRDGDYPQIRIPPAEAVQLVHHEHFMRAQGDAGEFPVELGVGGYQHIDAPFPGKGQPQVSQAALGHVMDDVVGLPFFPEHVLSVFQVHPAGAGGGHVVLVPDKEFDPQLLFQLQQLLVQGGLGDEQLLGGPGNAAGFRNLHNVFDLFQIHCAHLT